MKERLSILLSVKGLTALKFAEIMNVQPSSISHLLSGRNNPNYDFILKLIERFPDISPDWLLLGQGDMFRVIHTTPVEEAPREEKPIIEVHETEAKVIVEGKQASKIVTEEDSEVKDGKTSEINPLFSMFPQKEGVKVTKVIIFYNDGTFESFMEK
ncbi:MAG: helix-turn-helix transcriptional regulator [Rikenellaceae bacterium]